MAFVAPLFEPFLLHLAGITVNFRLVAFVEIHLERVNLMAFIDERDLDDEYPSRPHMVTLPLEPQPPQTIVPQGLGSSQPKDKAPRGYLRYSGPWMAHN